MLVPLLNNLLHLFGIGHVEPQWQDGISEALLQVGDICQLASGSRDLISAFESGFRPDAAKPSRGPVMNQVLFIVNILILGVYSGSVECARADNDHKRSI